MAPQPNATGKPNAKPAPSPSLPASATSAMLVGVKVKQWSASMVDKTATAEVATAHGAEAHALAVRKQMAQKADLKAVKKAATAIRTFHYEQTLPWTGGGDGLRLLPVVNYEDYRDGLRALKADFQAEAKKLADNWPAVLSAAQAQNGTLYHSDEYPSAREVEKAYHCEHYVVPVAQGSDMVANLPKGLRDEIAADIDRRTQAAEVAAMGSLWQRVHDAVQAMADKLPQFKPDGKGKERGTFRDSLVDNLRGLCDLLPRLNVTGDPALARVHTEMLAKLTKHDAKELRDDDATRAKVATDAQDILSKMAGYCGI